MTRLGAIGLALLCAACAAPSSPQLTASQPPLAPDPPPARMRELTATEQQLLAKMLAQSLKDPGSAQFRWTKFPQPTDGDRPVHYCAMVNSKNSFGGYVGHQPFLAVIGIRAGKIASGAIAATGSDRQSAQIIEDMCRSHGLDPYSL